MQYNSVKKILLLGGSGFLGRHICARLSQHLHPITVPTRRLPARHIQMLPGVSVVQANVQDAKQLQNLVRGHDVVINLIGILHGTSAAFMHTHATLPAQLARACHAENVTRVIHVSALGASTRAPSMYLRSKAHGELALLSATYQKSLGLTLIRPSVIFGVDDEFINLFAKLQKIFPFMPLAGAHAQFQPVWVQDVAHAIVHCVHTPSTQDQVFEACGPTVLTLRELVQLAGRWVGQPRPVVPLPAAVGWLQALLMEWLPGPTLLSRDNLDSMKVPSIASRRLPGLQALGVRHPASLQQVFTAQS